MSRDKNELLNELEQHRIDAKENQLKMDLKATELEKKWKMEIKVGMHDEVLICTASYLTINFNYFIAEEAM